MSEDIPEPVRAALADYAREPDSADLLFRVACAHAADPLPLHRVLYKFYNRQRRFELARDHADSALAEAAGQAGLPDAPETWQPADLANLAIPLASQLRLALKAQAFLALRAGDETAAQHPLAILRQIDPEDGSGASVVEALAESVRG